MSEENKNQNPAVNPAGEEIVLPPAGSLILSTSPHVHDGESISDIMLKVLICLVPVVAASVWVFGLDAIRVLVYCAVFCMATEYLWCVCTHQPQAVTDWSAAVTGVILALNLPSTAPWWMCLVGSLVAIIIAKQVFGGLGQNPFNPAAVARVALLIGFAQPMTHFVSINSADVTSGATVAIQTGTAADIVSSATPLTAAKMSAGTANALAVFDKLESGDHLLKSFIGNVGGSLGETSALAIIIGGIMLIAFRLIKWQIPVAMLGAAAIFTWIVNLTAPTLTPGPVFHLLSGGMMIGAFFMATDMVTSPMTQLGAVIFGAMTGLIACVIRIWGGYPEGVSFAIVIMNALVPLIDRFCYKRPLGWTPASVSALNMRRGEVK